MKGGGFKKAEEPKPRYHGLPPVQPISTDGGLSLGRFRPLPRGEPVFCTRAQWQRVHQIFVGHLYQISCSNTPARATSALPRITSTPQISLSYVFVLKSGDAVFPIVRDF